MAGVPGEDPVDPAQGRASLLANAYRELDRAGLEWFAVGATRREVVVERGAAAAASRALRREGFVPISRVARGDGWLHAGYDRSADDWLMLHLTDGPRLGGERQAGLPAELVSECLKRRRRVGDVAVPASDDERWLALLGRLLEQGSDAGLSGLPDEGAGPNGEAGAIGPFLDRLLPPGWDRRRLAEHIGASRWEELRPVRELIRARLGRRAALRVRLPMRRQPRPRGIAVAILGPDGVGKSTLVAALVKGLPLPIKTFYAGLYASSLARPFRRIPALRTLIELGKLWRSVVLAWLHRARGGVSLFDRYAYDAHLPLPEGAPLMARLRRKLLANSCPRPDLVVILDAPPAVLMGRRAERSPEVAAQHRRRYSELARQLPQAVAVDATSSAEEVRRRVTELIWRRLAEAPG